MQVLGNYRILGQIQSRVQDCLTFKVSRDAYSPTLRASVQQLTQAQIGDLRSGLLSSFFDSQEFVEEGFFVNMHDRTYLVRILDDYKIRAKNVDLSTGMLKAQDHRRLLVEALKFIDQVHGLGINIQECLQKYLEIQMKRGSHYVRFHKLSTKQHMKQAGQLICVDKRVKNSLSGDQVNLFLKFNSLLLSKHPSTEGRWKSPLTSTIQRWISLNPNPQIPDLIKILTTFAAQKCYAGSIFCELDTETGALCIQIMQQKTKQSLLYKQLDLVRINKGSKFLTTQQAFYKLSAQKQYNIDIISSNSLLFRDQYRQNEEVTLLLTQSIVRDNSELEPSDNHNQQLDLQDHDHESGVYEEGAEEPTSPQTPEDSKTLCFPYNCVVKIKAFYKVKNAAKTIRGVGSLIDSKFVLTSAHLVSFRFQGEEQRLHPYKILVQFCGKQFKVQNYNYPLDFLIRNHRIERENDYALVFLEESIILPRYLKIAKNFRSSSQIQLVKVRQSSSFNIVSMRVKQKVQKKSTVDHSLTTSAGDSGSPMMIELFKESSFYFLIAIHSGSSPRKKIATRITDRVAENLKMLQNRLEQRQFSCIQNSIIQYQLLIQRVKCFEKNYRDSLGPEEPVLGNQRKNWILQGIRLMDEERTDRMKLMQLKYVDIFQRWIIQMGSNNAFLFEDMSQLYHDNPQKRLKRQQLLRDIKQLIQQLSCLPSSDYIRKVYLNGMKILEFLLSVTIKGILSQQSIQWNNYAFTQSFMLMEQLYYAYKIPLQPFLLVSKLYSHRLQYGCQAPFLQQQLKPQEILLSVNMFTASVGCPLNLNIQQINLSIEMSRKNWQSYLEAQEINLRVFSDQMTMLAPFTMKPCQRFYKLLRFYQYEIEVFFEKKTEVDEYLWQQVQFVYHRFPMTIPRRQFDPINSTNRLILKFKNRLNFTLFHFSKFIMKCPLTLIISVIIQIIDYLLALHEKNLSCCCPIQLCSFLDLSEGVVYFYYFGHYKALVHRVRGLTGGELRQWRDYYPIDEILANQNKRQAFKNIDIWMLGKYLERNLEAVSFHCSYDNDFLWKYLLMIEKMTCAVESRTCLKQVRSQLETLLLERTKEAQEPDFSINQSQLF